MKFHSMMILSSAIALAANAAVWAQDETSTNTTTATQAEADNGADLFESDKARYSYFIGADMGQGIKQLEDVYEFDKDQLMSAIEAALNGEELVMNQEQMIATSEEFRTLFQESAQEKAEEEAASRAESNAAFLEENAAKDSVTVTDSGLQYEVISEGEGEKPSASDTVTVHYTGTLIDGTEFDSSIARGEPATFPLNQVIDGWSEGVQLMSPGAKYKFTLPPELGYGEQGIPGSIPASSVLQFEVELLSINDEAAGSQTQTEEAQ